MGVRCGQAQTFTGALAEKLRSLPKGCSRCNRSDFYARVAHGQSAVALASKVKNSRPLITYPKAQDESSLARGSG
jgi:hypothetical protein